MDSVTKYKGEFEFSILDVLMLLPVHLCVCLQGPQAT